MMQGIPNEDVKRILIIKPSSMGDILHGLLVAEAIKARLPEVSIDWVVRSEFAPLIEASRVVEHVYMFHRKGGIGAFYRLIREIRTQTYDVVLDMQGLARSGLMTFFARGQRKLGRSDAREGAGLFYHERTAPLPAGPVHAVKILSGFLELLGLPSDVEQGIRFEAGGAELLPSKQEQHPRILIFPESRRAEKNWLGYEALTRLLLERACAPEVVWCGHVPFDAKEPIVSERFTNLTGKTGIDQLPGLLSTADCVVSNDSGPMHLAASMARPLVALFGPTDPACFGPFPQDTQRQRVIRPEGGDMSLVSAEDVKAAVAELVSSLD